MSIIERDAALSETAHTIAGLLRVAHLTYTHGRPAGESTRALQQRQAERLVRLQQPGAMTQAETAAHLAVRLYLDAYIRGVCDSASIRDVCDSASIRDVCGSASIRGVGGSASISGVWDSASIRGVWGSASIRDVGGSASIRGVWGSALLDATAKSHVKT